MSARLAAVLLLTGVTFLAGITLLCPAHAQDPQTKKALETIIDTANQICQSAPLQETSQGVSLSGDANAKLGGLVGKIADLGITGAAQYQTNRSMGVLQKDLIIAIQSGNNCKLEVFKMLEKDLISGRAVPSAGDASPKHGAAMPSSYPPSPRRQPSFSCERATIEVEFLICGSTRLADLDVKMVDAYEATLARLPLAAQQGFKREQWRWLQQRNACQQNGDIMGCLERAYSNRLSILAAYN